jgi:hypothetical protein
MVFLMNHTVNGRLTQPLKNAGGWKKALDTIQDPAVINGLETYSRRHYLIVIDFDTHVDERISYYKELVDNLPKSVGDRIYLLGTFDEPKDLKEACGLKLEDIGRQLAQDCPPAPTYGLWSHAHLQHNAAELERLVAQVRPFLFRS